MSRPHERAGAVPFRPFRDQPQFVQMAALLISTARPGTLLSSRCMGENFVRCLETVKMYGVLDHIQQYLVGQSLVAAWRFQRPAAT